MIVMIWKNDCWWIARNDLIHNRLTPIHLTWDVSFQKYSSYIARETSNNFGDNGITINSKSPKGGWILWQAWQSWLALIDSWRGCSGMEWVEWRREMRGANGKHKFSRNEGVIFDDDDEEEDKEGEGRRWSLERNAYPEEKNNRSP